ncbi:nucleotide exchange factor GrpE [Saprospiraceae bacterium]|jgi:molecular chaperone GrpE|nr:nucleotide exchange factor GrpE [Saprospiraceae bacterium]|tara:strand:+ start:1331 stop:1909 length:579 start_codon:yes stop_codon:yes gene_type:complete
MFNKLRNKMTKKQEEIQDEEVIKDEKDTKSKKKTKSSKKDKLTDRIEELEQELSESKDKFLRLFAEFDNFKKRTAKERIDFRATAGMDALQAFLPVMDDFDRAKKVAENEDNNEEFSEGVKLVYQKLKSVLTSKGIKVMESTGETFDPELHEAITEIPAPTEDMKGKIIDTIEQGYYLNDKIIRYARVVVGN